MFHHHLRRIKIHFSLVTLAVVLTMSVGAVYLSNLFHRNPTYFYFTKDYIQKNVTYFEYRYEIERQSMNPWQAILSLLKTTYQSEPVFAAGTQDKLTSLPVLLYHGIIQKPDGHNVLEKNFKAQMFALKKAGYQTVTIEQAYEFLQGKKDLPNKSILITFDDGRKDSYYGGDPILKAAGFTAVNSVITSHSTSEAENHYYLTLGELKQMINTKRWEIESHSYIGHDYTTVDASGHTGPFFTSKAWIKDQNRLETEEEFEQRIRTDLQIAKTQLHDVLGINAIAFAFPFGEYGQRDTNIEQADDVVLSIVRSVYPLALYQVRTEPHPEKRNYPARDPFLVRRIEVSPDWDGDQLLHVVASTEDKALPFRDDLSQNVGWIQLWGGQQYTPQNISFFATPGTTGALSILDGGYLWKNYSVTAEAQLVSGQTYTIVARYKSSGNYVDCKYGQNHITLEEYIDGKVTQLAIDQKDFFNTFPATATLSIRVNSHSAECLLNGHPIIKSDAVDSSLDRGTIGFTVWDPGLGVSILNVKNIQVDAL